jgi:hypothetical protein
MADITTTEGTVFTHEQSADLALMIYYRFGRDMNASCAAWKRMLQNSTPVEDFTDLLINAAARLPRNEAIRHLLAL